MIRHSSYSALAELRGLGLQYRAAVAMFRDQLFGLFACHAMPPREAGDLVILHLRGKLGVSSSIEGSFAMAFLPQRAR